MLPLLSKRKKKFVMRLRTYAVQYSAMPYARKYKLADYFNIFTVCCKHWPSELNAEIFPFTSSSASSNRPN